MVAELGLFIDGRWRSLRSLEAEGKVLDFVVVRRGVHKKLARPPHWSRIRAGLPLHFRRIKRSKDIYKPTYKDVPIFINKTRQQPLTEVEINNKYSNSSPLINAQNLKAEKCFPQSTLQKAYKSVPEHHNNNSQEKGIVIIDSSEDESSTFLGKEIIDSSEDESSTFLGKVIIDSSEDEGSTFLGKENRDIPKKDAKNSEKLAQNTNKHSTSKKSNRNLISTLIINDHDDKVTVTSEENVENENISEDDFEVIHQPSRIKENNKSVESSMKSSNDKMSNAEKKLENESSIRKEYYKNAQPSTSKGSNQNLQSLSSLTNNKLQNDEDSAAESESSRPLLELVVEPEDLELMWQCLIKEPFFKVDIDRIGKDELYRQITLNKLQPVVQVVPLKPGLHHQLSVSPRRTGNVSSGRIKRSKHIHKPTDKYAPIFTNKKRQQPLTEVEINNKYSKSSPLINAHNLKAYKCFPQSTLQKAYKSVPEHHNKNAQEKGIVIKDSSEDKSSKFAEKENKNILKEDTKNSKNNLAQHASKQQLQQHTTSKRSNSNLKSALNDNDDKVTANSKEKQDKENISEDDFEVNHQPSRIKGNNKSIESSVKSSNVKIRNAEKKLENESSKRKDIHKNAQPSTSKGINQNLQSKSSLTNDKLRNDEDSAAESESSAPCLELVVEPEDLKLMRQCLIKEPVFKVDIDRFDKDELYRQRTLYKLQPVVQVVHLKPGLHHQLSVSSRRAGNASSGSSLTKKAKTSTTTDNIRRRSPVRIRKSSVKAGREYSSLEDHAIVSWLSASRSREHAVNGNRVWRELEAHHARLTGQDRSWHSLRNRYLRYILPALGKLALSPSHAQRLRAAAATGAMKSRKKRPPSILVEPTVPAAHRRACLRPSIVPSDTESNGNLHHKEQKKNMKAIPSKKQRTEPHKDAAVDSSDDENLHHKNKKAIPSKKQRTEPHKDAVEDSSNDDENLHHKDQRKDKKAIPSKKQRSEPHKDAVEDSSDDENLHHKEYHRNKKAIPSKKQRAGSQKDAAQDSSDDEDLHHKEQHKNKKTKPSKKQRTGLQKDVAQDNSDDENLHHKNKKAIPSKKQRSEPHKDAAEDSSSDDGILHHKVQRPSLRPRNKNAGPSTKRRSEPQKYLAEDSSDNDENFHHKEQHKNKKANPSKKQRTEPHKDAADDSSSDDENLHHKEQHKNKKAIPSQKQRTEPHKDTVEDSISDDGILHHKVQRPSLRPKNKNAGPSKKRRSEPVKYVVEDSTDDDGILHHKVQHPSLRPKNKNAGLSKKRWSEPQKYVAEESSNDDDAPPLELSRLRPRPSRSLRFSDGSGDDKSFDPSPAKKKRRRLYNP